MIQPKVTVGTVCYNAEGVIENLIKSVLSQTYDNIEFVIVDGASKDGTIDVINRYKDKIDTIVSEPDKGIYDAMNKLLTYATGDYLIFMGADDVFYNNDVIAKMASKMTDKDSVYYGSVIFKGIGTKHWGKFNKVKWATTNVCHQAIFYPRSVYSTHAYDVRYKLFADYAYNLVLLKEKHIFQYVDLVIVLYDVNGASSSNNDALFYEKYAKMVINAVGFIPYLLGICIRNAHYLKLKLLKNG